MQHAIVFRHAQYQSQKKLKKNEQRSPPQLAARTSGHVIWSRLYAANVDHSHALGLAKHRTRAEFQTLLWLGYCRRCSDWTRATTRMLLELSIITSPNRVLTQCSGPIYEPHSNIVPGGCCYHQGTSSKFAKERLKENARFLLEITPQQRGFLVSGVACECTWVPLVPVSSYKVKNAQNEYRCTAPLNQLKQYTTILKLGTSRTPLYILRLHACPFCPHTPGFLVLKVKALVFVIAWLLLDAGGSSYCYFEKSSLQIEH